MQRIGRKNARYILAVLIAFIVIAFFTNNFSVFYKIRYPLKYKEYVLKYSEKSKVDPYLVFAIIKAESGFNPNAVSGKNAMGLMQITEKTGEWGAQRLKIVNFKANDLYDPETNIKIGCWYIASLIDEFENKDLAIAAYNGGSGNVSKWLKDRNFSSDGIKLNRIPFKETENFLKRVNNYQTMYKRLYENS